MGFKNKQAVKIALVKTAPAEKYVVFRDKIAGTACVDIWDKAISFQKAGSLVQGMFPVPVKFDRSERMGNVERRHYVAQGWH